MQVFKTDKKLYWANELKSWLWRFTFIVILYFGLKYFFSFKNDNIILVVVVILLLKLGDTLSQYHVKEIQIDRQKKEMAFILSSRMSGEKIKTYKLEQATSELIKKSGFARYLSSPLTLKVFLKPKDTFVINNRHGFTLDTLTSVDKELKSIHISA